MPRYFQNVPKKYVQVFLKIEDEYLKERVSDINDFRAGASCAISCKAPNARGPSQEKGDIGGSMTFPFRHRGNVQKECPWPLLLDVGGKTSHTAIMAKSMEIPAVAGLEKGILSIKTGDILT